MPIDWNDPAPITHDPELDDLIRSHTTVVNHAGLTALIHKCPDGWMIQLPGGTYEITPHKRGAITRARALLKERSNA